MRYEKEDMSKALEVLNAGGIILYPTDTIWGIGCDATNPEAVKKVYELKQREDSKSMLVLMENPNLVSRFIEEVPDIAWQLLEASDKPMTIIYPGAQKLAENLIADDGSVGIRITEEKFTQDLIARFKRPIVSTSANISGQPSPAFFDEISDEVKDKVDYIVNFRQDDRTKKTASSIIKIGLGGEFQILRK